jgi:hypothetical protein
MKIFAIITLSFTLCLTNLNSQNKKTVFSIPEMLELFNIASCLTELVNDTVISPIETNSIYFVEMQKHFSAFKNHDLIQKLNEKNRKNLYHYITNREYAINFYFEGNKIKEKNIFNWKLKTRQLVLGNTFKKQRRLWEDFAQKSGFRAFYAAHQAEYDRRLSKMQQYLPADKMITWLDAQFGSFNNNYRIITSPLIGATHSTFQTVDNTRNIVVSDADKYNSENIEKEIALYSSISFTEFDHQHCNRLREQFQKEVEAAFSNRSAWNNNRLNDTYYSKNHKLFDEYLTHAVHIVYLKDNYSKETFEYVKQRRIEMNKQRRGLAQFDGFTEELLRLYAAKSANQTLKDMMPDLLKWCAQRNLTTIGNTPKTSFLVVKR